MVQIDLIRRMCAIKLKEYICIGIHMREIVWESHMLPQACVAHCILLQIIQLDGKNLEKHGERDKKTLLDSI